MIEIRVDAVLAEHGRTFYWLAKETGISHTTLWRLKNCSRWSVAGALWQPSFMTAFLGW